MSKTIFTIITVFLLITIVGGGIWFFFFYKNAPSIEDFSTTVRDYLPFGKIEAPKTANNGQQTTGNGENGNTGSVLSKVRLLSQIPVSGFVVIDATSTVSVRYMERATGHIYEIGTKENTARRITNTTIPRVYESIFAPSGAFVLIRYLRDDNRTIETYSAIVPNDRTVDGAELKGVFLPQGISTITISPDSKKIFYITPFGGGSIGFTSGPQNESKQQIFNSPLSEWLALWPEIKSIYLTTKTSSGVIGYSFILNQTTKSLEKIVNGAGLTTLYSPDGKFISKSTTNESGELSFGVYDIKYDTTIPFSVKTLPEKCAWSYDSTKIYCAIPIIIPTSKIPDAWYQGRIGFSDRVWMLDTQGGSNMIFDLTKETGKQIDVINISINKKGTNLFFTNKKDQSLWSIEL